MRAAISSSLAKDLAIRAARIARINTGERSAASGVRCEGNTERRKRSGIAGVSRYVPLLAIAARRRN